MTFLSIFSLSVHDFKKNDYQFNGEMFFHCLHDLNKNDYQFSGKSVFCFFLNLNISRVWIYGNSLWKKNLFIRIPRHIYQIER